MAEKTVIFEVTDFSLIDGFISLLASYYVFYVNYPSKSVPAQSLLLFFQEYILESPEPSAKKTARYRTTVSTLVRYREDDVDSHREERSTRKGEDIPEATDDSPAPDESLHDTQ